MAGNSREVVLVRGSYLPQLPWEAFAPSTFSGVSGYMQSMDINCASSENPKIFGLKIGSIPPPHQCPWPYLSQLNFHGDI